VGRRFRIALIVLALVALGCDNPSASGPIELPLPTTRAEPPPPDVIAGCSSVLEPAVLHGNATLEPATWLIRMDDGTRRDIVWPGGFRARFAPHLEVVDETGSVVTGEGDCLQGGCMVGDAAAILLVPPYPGFRLDCGPRPRTSCAALALEVAKRNGWPDRDLEVVAFTHASDGYLVRFADGDETQGDVDD